MNKPEKNHPWRIPFAPRKKSGLFVPSNRIPNHSRTSFLFIAIHKNGNTSVVDRREYSAPSQALLCARGMMDYVKDHPECDVSRVIVTQQIYEVR